MLARVLVLTCVIGMGTIAPGCVGAHDFPAGPYERAFLIAEPWPDLYIEIDYADGHEPSSLALDALRRTLPVLVEKRSIVVLPPTKITLDLSNFSSDSYWDKTEILALHAALFDSSSPGSMFNETAGLIHVMYLPGIGGNFEERLGSGIAFLNLVTIHPDTLVSEFPPWREDLLERSILLHEIGHTLGLVNKGARMLRDHANATDPHHSSNPYSVMHTGLSTLRDDNGTWGPPYMFDADDLADLAAYREELKASNGQTWW